MPDIRYGVTTQHHYPPKTIQQARRLLSADYAVWLLSPGGMILAANLLACSLWGRLTVQQGRVHVAGVLGRNVLDLFTEGLRTGRIPYDQNISLLRAKYAVDKRMLQKLGPFRPFVDFRNTVLAHPMGRQAADYVEQELAATAGDVIANEWEYTLRIHPSDDLDTSLLEFDTVVSEVYHDSEIVGFVAEYRTTRASTMNIMHERLNYLEAEYNGATYIVLIGGDNFLERNEGPLPFIEDHKADGEQVVKFIIPPAPIPAGPVEIVCPPLGLKPPSAGPVPEWQQPPRLSPAAAELLYQNEQRRSKDDVSPAADAENQDSEP